MYSLEELKKLNPSNSDMIDENIVSKVNEIAEILEEDNKVKGLVLENSETGEKEELMINGIFPFIGLDPMTQCAKSLGIVNAEGYIDANENMETAVKGVFVAGDVRSKQLRQVVTATNDGAIAGQYIASLK
jgi:thioredoxin reductase (NADPH)